MNSGAFEAGPETVGGLGIWGDRSSPPHSAGQVGLPGQGLPVPGEPGLILARLTGDSDDAIGFGVEDEDEDEAEHKRELHAAGVFLEVPRPSEQATAWCRCAVLGCD